MTRISIFWALLLSPGFAVAEISDSGDLLLGGQAIVAGTMTVQGSSLSINGVGYGFPSAQGAADQVLINNGAGGLSWQDQSRGDAGLASTQTWTGANAFSSTITVGQGVVSTTASYAGIIRGGQSEVALSTFSAATLVRFTQIQSSYTTVIEIKTKQNSTIGLLFMRFEDDSSNSYKWSSTRWLSDGTSETSADSGNSECRISGGSNILVGGGMRFRIALSRTPGIATDRIMATWLGSFILSDGKLATMMGSCDYTPSAPGDGVISVSLYPSAGNWTGIARVVADVTGIDY